MSPFLTCKHSDLIDVIKFSEILAIEASPKICNKDLSALIQSDSFSIELCLISEASKVFGEQVDQACCGEIGIFNAGNKASSKFLSSIALGTNFQ